jgi:hypothetical protein
MLTIQRTILALILAAGATTMPAFAQDSTVIRSEYCRTLHAGMRRRPAFKAFALSRNGRICHAVWGEARRRAAERKAVARCQDNGERVCRLVRLNR